MTHQFVIGQPGEPPRALSVWDDPGGWSPYLEVRLNGAILDWCVEYDRDAGMVTVLDLTPEGRPYVVGSGDDAELAKKILHGQVTVRVTERPPHRPD